MAGMSITTVGDLIARLEEYDPDAELRAVIQPSWPLEKTVVGVKSTNEIQQEQAYSDGGPEIRTDELESDATGPVYVLVGEYHPDDNHPYGPAGVYDGT
jgi:hypothetical protein